MRGHALGCHGPCTTTSHARSEHPDSPSALTMMADLWLLGAADHVIAASSKSTFTDYARRGFGFGAHPQDLTRHLIPAPHWMKKRIHFTFQGGVCTPLPPSGNGSRGERNGLSDVCLAARWLFLSPFLQTQKARMGRGTGLRVCAAR